MELISGGSFPSAVDNISIDAFRIFEKKYEKFLPINENKNSINIQKECHE